MEIYDFYYKFSIVYTLFKEGYKFTIFNIASQLFIFRPKRGAQSGLVSKYYATLFEV